MELNFTFFDRSKTILVVSLFCPNRISLISKAYKLSKQLKKKNKNISLKRKYKLKIVIVNILHIVKFEKKKTISLNFFFLDSIVY